MAKPVEPTLRQMIGKTFLDQLDVPIFVVGKTALTRDELAGMGVTHLGACRLLSTLLKDVRPTLRDVPDVYQRFDVATLAGTRGRGLACLFVLLRIFEHFGLNGSSWYMRGRSNVVRTFSTIKRHEYLAGTRSKKKSGGRQEFAPTKVS